MDRSPRRIAHLIASGPTAWQDDDRIQGDTDLPLSPSGEARVADAAAHFDGEGVRTIVCAPDEASRQTAARFAARCGAKVKPVEELSEMNLGLWQGLPRRQLKERYAKAYHRWREDPANVNIPEGESLEEAAERMRSAVARQMSKSPDRPLAVVLRPILLGLCSEWLRGVDGHRWRPDDQPPPVETVEVDEDRWKALRSEGKKTARKTTARRLSA